MKIPSAALRVLQSVGIDPTLTGGDLLTAIVVRPDGRRRRILGSSTKTKKGERQGVLTAVAYLAPAQTAGVNTCPHATGCARVCLTSPGHMRWPASKRARILRTLHYWLFREDFLRQLNAEIDAHAAKAARLSLEPACRLNGTSDLRWERHGIPQKHSDVRFYDYTKHPLSARAKLDNYHLTYSWNEGPEAPVRAAAWLASGGAVAVVVRGQATARALVDAGTWRGHPTVDGDRDDLRFRDPPRASWVILYAKGAAVRDDSGFVVDP